MLNFEIKTVSGRKTGFSRPLKYSIISDKDAPADSLSAVFCISGRVPVLKEIVVRNGGETIFCGEIDRQSEVISGDSHVLEISSRSLAAILLDNEAKPQQYCMPSMPLLMSRHFAPLGFDRYTGTEKAFNGELVINKGMSQWEVLETFCEKFLHTKPKLSEDGTIDISGSDSGGSLVIGKNDGLLYIKRTVRRDTVVSDIYARTCNTGDYETYIGNERAAEFGVKRVRYVSSINHRSRSVLETREIIPKLNRKARQYELLLSGSVLCRVGDKLRIEGESAGGRITEIHLSCGESGERTRIFAEVDEDVAWQEHD